MGRDQGNGRFNNVEQRVKRDTVAGWAFKNPILGPGEMGLELDTIKLKFGDGVTRWDSLPYFGSNSGGAGTVTSVNASASGALSVSGVPITTSGTLTFSWTGNSNQQVLGDGTLATRITNNNQLINGAGYITSAALAGYVPYTGATSNVDLGLFSLTTPNVIGASGLNISSTSGNISLSASASISGTIATTGSFSLSNGAVNMAWRAVPTVPTYSGVFLNVTPSSVNYALVNNGLGDTFVNGSTSTYLQAGATDIVRATFPSIIMTPGNQGAGSFIPLRLNVSNQTNNTASVEVPTFVINSFSRTWATGALTTQRGFWVKALTMAFTNASTVTDAYGAYIESPIAGTNATITNLYSLGLSGHLNMLDGFGIKFGTSTGGNVGLTSSDKVGYWGATPVVRPSAATTIQGFYDSMSTIGLISTGTITTRSINVISTNTNAGNAANTDYVYLVTATCTLTLPSTVGNTNRYSVKIISPGAVCTVSGNIDGATSAVLSTLYSSIDLVPNSGNYYIL
jgi:hypothetical protein